jgi:hypothetical protein
MLTLYSPFDRLEVLIIVFSPELVNSTFICCPRTFIKNNSLIALVAFSVNDCPILAGFG